jgi:cell division protein FtsB
MIIERMATETFITKTKNVMMRIVHLKYKKYVIALILGVVIVGFLGDNSVMAHLRNKSRINALKAEIELNRALTERNQQQIYQLQADPKTMEKVGRERYFMREDDEDVFVFSDEAYQITDIEANESVE